MLYNITSRSIFNEKHVYLKFPETSPKIVVKVFKHKIKLVPILNVIINF